MKSLIAVLGVCLLAFGGLAYYFHSLSASGIFLSPAVFWRMLAARKTIVREAAKSVVFAPSATNPDVLLDDSGIYPIYLLATQQSPTDARALLLTVLHTQKNRNIIFTLPYFACADTNSPTLVIGHLYQMGLVTKRRDTPIAALQAHYPDLATKCDGAVLKTVANINPISEQSLRQLFATGTSVAGLPTLALGPYRFVSHNNSLYSFVVKPVTHD